ncbi:hypothetical protein, partial [Mycobacterium intracellulare]|uniref:hypothetical protein n=1 Tax=Mycobacterium intracellulare TaxID=1767 RepID=UPI0019D6CAA2
TTLRTQPNQRLHTHNRVCIELGAVQFVLLAFGRHTAIDGRRYGAVIAAPPVSPSMSSAPNRRKILTSSPSIGASHMPAGMSSTA